jgi:hypothetical protein
MKTRFRIRSARANDHVIFFEHFQQGGNLFGRVLAIGVEHYKTDAPRIPDTGFYRRPVPYVIRMTKDCGAGLMGPLSGCVGRSVIYHDDFIAAAGFVEGFADPADYRFDPLRFVFGGDYNAYLQLFGRTVPVLHQRLLHCASPARLAAGLGR